MRATEEVLGANVGLPRRRNPCVEALDGERKAIRRDADNLQRLPIDANAATLNVWIAAELVAPEAIGNDDCLGAAIRRPGLAGLEWPAERDGNPEDIEEVSR